MTPEQKGNIKRLMGDAQTVAGFLQEIEKIEDDYTILYKLRQVVSKCDYISSTIEREFIVKEIE